MSRRQAVSKRVRLLTIAGSDSGGGAGIQADLKTFAAFGGYGMSAVTAVTAQNTQTVRALALVPPALVSAQIAAVAEDLGIDGDLPQPVCAQDDEKASPELGWGPPPLMAVKFDVIACLIREANEARNARRQRYGL